MRWWSVEDRDKQFVIPPTSASSSSSPCIDRLVSAFNSLDVSRITVDDGLDDSERADIEAQYAAITKDQPDLSSNGACQTAFAQLSDAEKSAVFARVRPDVIAVLGASATRKFNSVASSIN